MNELKETDCEKVRPERALNQNRNQEFKRDAGRPRWELLPLKLIRGVVEVLTFGAMKYKDDSWKRVDPERYRGAMMRHLDAMQDGEVYDKESGLPHIDHAMCNLVFLKHFQLGEEESLDIQTQLFKDLIEMGVVPPPAFFEDLFTEVNDD